MSPSLRWWPSWWWSLHLRSFRCRLLDGSHYTRPTYVVQIEPTQTTPKPLQTLAFIGVSQPHDGDEKTADATATAAPRHGHIQGRHGHVTTATTGTDMIAYKGTCPRDTTRHATRQPNKHSSEQTFDRTHVPMLHIRQTPPRVGECPPGSKSRGRWLSSADAECSLEHFWITRYLRSLHIFSGCNRFCTLHIVYNVPWIDVDGGRAQLGSASISGCYHSLRVA